jgi:hypothetical protein
MLTLVLFLATLTGVKAACASDPTFVDVHGYNCAEWGDDPLDNCDQTVWAGGNKPVDCPSRTSIGCMKKGDSPDPTCGGTGCVGWGGKVNDFVYVYTDAQIRDVQTACPVICALAPPCPPPPSPAPDPPPPSPFLPVDIPCSDDESFIDVHDFPCGDIPVKGGWTKDDCYRQVWNTRWYYTKCELFNVRRYCPVTCDLCNEQLSAEFDSMAAICDSGEELCGGDDPTFTDKTRVKCSGWIYHDCTKSYRRYTDADMEEVRTHCPNACAIAPPTCAYAAKEGKKEAHMKSDGDAHVLAPMDEKEIAHMRHKFAALKK